MYPVFSVKSNNEESNMSWLRQLLFIVVSISIVNVAMAQKSGKSFSAMAVQTTPQGVVQTRITISSNAIRNEYQQDGHKMIEIIYPDENKRVMLFPGQKIFIEQYAPSFPDRRVTDGDSPCEKLAGTLCRKLGDEVVNDIQTEKWEFTRVEKGRPVHTLHWIDRKRQLPVREFFADGSIVEMFFLGDDQINKRNAEKWRMQLMSADGKRSQFLQWYDPELKLVIREEHPDGYVRELRDIKVGKQKKSLFTIPEGYERRVKPPMQQGKAR